MEVNKIFLMHLLLPEEEGVVETFPLEEDVEMEGQEWQLILLQLQLLQDPVGNRDLLEEAEEVEEDRPALREIQHQEDLQRVLVKDDLVEQVDHQVQTALPRVEVVEVDRHLMDVDLFQKMVVAGQQDKL